MPDPQCALIFDDEKNGLGQLALHILRVGVDVFYAKDGEEARLLAMQEADRIRVVLFPPSVDLDQLSALQNSLQSGQDPKPRTLVVVGERPDEATRVRLRECGVDWALWLPYDESALRQVLADALAVRHHTELRKGPRLPTTLLGRVFVGVRRKDVIVSTLSLGGAFLETPTPFLEGTRITLELALPDGQALTKGEVVYARSACDSGPAGHPAGMGVAFADLDATSQERLQRFLDELQDRFGV